MSDELVRLKIDLVQAQAKAIDKQHLLNEQINANRACKAAIDLAQEFIGKVEEWTGDSTGIDPCQICGGYFISGHKPDCLRARTLAAITHAKSLHPPTK